MSITGIVLIIAGVIVLALGYLVPVRKKDIDTESLLISEDEIRRMVDRELDNVKTHISDIVDETVTYSMEKTERSMERVANEKIMAVNEYSDTVLEEINKNHKEVIFLYDMLNDKHENLKSAVVEATQTTDEVRQTLKDAIVTAQQADKAIEHVEMLAKDTGEAIIKAMDEMGEMLKEAAYEKETARYQTQPVNQRDMYKENFAQEDTEEAFAEDEEYSEEGFSDADDHADEGYADEEYIDERYADEEYADERYANEGYADKRYANEGYADKRYANEGYADKRYADEGYADKRYADEGYTDKRYADERYVNKRNADAAEDEYYAAEEDFTEKMNRAYEEPAYTGADFARGRTAEKMRFDDEEDYFVPITPPRVNIIHDPDGDYVADPPQMAPAAEREEGRRPARRQPAAKKTTSRPASAKSAKRNAAPEYPAARMADAKSVNIQFANGRDNGRNSNERILELHKAGKSNMAIAKELGLGIGEVKLVIDLFEGL